MKSVAIGLCLVLSSVRMNGQSENAAKQVIEGGKVVVELIKVLAAKKDLDKNPGCKNAYADVCIVNESAGPLLAIFIHRNTGEKREMVIQSKTKECSLQAAIGVWTYDLRDPQSPYSIRKGDILIEGCQNLTMNIKY